MVEEVVGHGKWVLKGTSSQVDVLRPVFEPASPSFIAFPWARIDDLPSFPVPISWDDLNDGSFGEHESRTETAIADTGQRSPVNPHLVKEEDEGHAILRPSRFFGHSHGEERLMTAGVFWTDGRIKIDYRLEANPSAAREVLSAELAHAVDYGLPLSGSQKVAIMRLFHGQRADSHTWWEREDYGGEYYSLVGESWMALFTHAYSTMDPWQDPFIHKSMPSMAPKVRQILGISPVSTSSPAFDLRARIRRTRFGNVYAHLEWEGAEGSKVNVLRNGAPLGVTTNDGRYVNFLGSSTGAVSYFVIDATGRRSNGVTLTT